MEGAENFIFEIWKSSAYYDFENSFRIPDTFYMFDNGVDWIFTGNKGKILRKKKENCNINAIKEYFCGLQGKDDDCNHIICSELILDKYQNTCYFKYIDLTSICDLIVSKFLKNNDKTTAMIEERSREDCSQIIRNNSKRSMSTNTRQKRVSSLSGSIAMDVNNNGISHRSKGREENGAQVIQKYMEPENRERSMIKAEWNLKDKVFDVEQRMNTFESSAKQDEYKKYILFEADSQFLRIDTTMKEKEQIFKIVQHVKKSMNLIHRERGRVIKMILLLKKLNNEMFLLACPCLLFEHDERRCISFELTLKYPEQNVHITSTLNEALQYIQETKETKNIRQCECCRLFSSESMQINPSSLSLLRIRQGITTSLDETRELKKKLFCEVCSKCFALSLDMSSKQSKQVEPLPKTFSHSRKTQINQSLQSECAENISKPNQCLLPPLFDQIARNSTKDLINNLNSENDSTMNQFSSQNLLQIVSSQKNQISIQDSDNSIQSDSTSTSLRSSNVKFGLKMALMNLKKDVKKQQIKQNSSLSKDISDIPSNIDPPDRIKGDSTYVQQLDPDGNDMNLPRLVTHFIGRPPRSKDISDIPSNIDPPDRIKGDSKYVQQLDPDGNDMNPPRLVKKFIGRPPRSKVVSQSLGFRDSDFPINQNYSSPTKDSIENKTNFINLLPKEDLLDLQ